MMSDLTAFNRETPADRQRRKARAAELTSGRAGADGLTDADRDLLAVLRRDGLDIRHGWLTNDRSGDHWRHDRVIVQGAPSWSHPQRRLE
jgi:hypothetical protein